MVTRTPLFSQPPDTPGPIADCQAGLSWRQQLAQAITQAAELLAALNLPESLLPAADQASTQFRLRVPWSFVRRMRPGDPDDPLLLQALPAAAELNPIPGFVSDPVGDLAASQGPGIIHKYPNRLLLIATGACAINCRYCFRRAFPYLENSAAQAQFGPALEYIRAHPEVDEVILSGGDPLLLGTLQLQRLSEQLSSLPQIRRLRIHTRLPIVLPARVSDHLCQWTRQLPWPLTVVVHCNHAREINGEVRLALTRWRQAGAHLLNQSVLLRGVNDSVPALAELSEALFDSGVLPYYLNLLDRVQGSAHFEVDQMQAQELMIGLRKRLSGYLVPRLVREQAGAPYKLPAE